jgi:hypothetical protein
LIFKWFENVFRAGGDERGKPYNQRGRNFRLASQAYWCPAFPFMDRRVHFNLQKSDGQILIILKGNPVGLIFTSIFAGGPKNEYTDI